MPGHIILSRQHPKAAVTFESALYDLLYEETDAIVNAANGGLSHGGGIAAAIAQAAGEALGLECDEYVERFGRLSVGQAIVTTAGRLPFKGIVHCVGPRMGSGREEENIVATLHAAFRIACYKGWRSLSFPSISSGIYGVPYDRCARAYMGAFLSFDFAAYPDQPTLIRHIVADEKMASCMKALDGGASS